MSNSNNYWFHCGRCNALFMSTPGDIDNRLCSKCGFDPSLGLAGTDTTPAQETPRTDVAVNEKAEAVGNPGKRTVRKRKNQHLMLKLACAWLAVLAIIVAGAKYLWHDDKTAAQAAPPKLLKESSNEDQVTYDAAWKECARALSGFLTAGTPEARNQFVFQPVTTASRMAKFYALNPIINIDLARLTVAEHAVLNIPGGKELESVWDVEDGRRIDAAFREENGEWKIDWDHFVRYSDYPWPLFLAGSGADDGEFRLLARERLAEERKNAENISIVLYAPRFGNPHDTGFQSPEFLVSRNTSDGKLLDAAFDLVRQKKKVFGSTTSNMDPEGMIRVRAKVRRTNEAGERKFSISKIIACHWYSVDDPGLEPISGAGSREGKAPDRPANATD